MAPALTKITKDGHGVHLSSPLASNNMDKEGAILSIELDPQLKLMEDSYSQRLWLNLSSLPFLDTCCSKSALEFPESLLSPLLQAGQYKTVLLSNPGSLLSLLSLNKTLKDSQVAYSGAQDMYFVPIPEHNSQGVAQQCQQHSGHGQDGYDIPQSPPHCQGETMSQYNTAFLTPPIVRQGHVGCISPGETAPTQPWTARSRHEQPASVEEAVRDQTLWHVSKQAALVGRAGRIQKRLQAILGEHASRHCSLQLEGLKGRQFSGTPSSPADIKPFDPPMVQGQAWTLSHRTHCPPLLKTSTPPSPSTDVQEFARYGKAVLRGLQVAVDSDATDSSSSDEDLEHETKWGTKFLPISSSSSHGSKWRWQAERAEVGSRWTWLQLRVAELEGRVQQLDNLHKRIVSTKGGVVLAECQPMTDRQIQQTLLTETAGLSFTAGSGGNMPSDTENEPSSPTRLLRNIERQSAQLSQIVNSLMPPLNLSPSSSPISKKPCRWKGQNKGAFNSCLSGGDLFSQKGTKRRRVARSRKLLLQVNATCVSARTRPLVTYHKPRLFTMNTPSGLSYQDQQSHSSSSTCPTCASCDPLAVCSSPACSNNNLNTGTSHARTHPVLSLSSDTPLSQHLQNAVLREDWVQWPLPMKTETPSPVHYHSYRDREPSFTPTFRYMHNHKPHGRHRKGGVRGVSPIRWAGSAQTPHKRAYRGGRKRRHTYRMMEDEEDLLSQLSDPEDSAEEGPEETFTPQASLTRKQGPIRRRQGESVYNIDNIVIPMSLAATTKVEKLQYKDIITPRWRVIDNLPPEEREEEEEEEEEDMELLSDETFCQRHLGCEQREKLRWSSWDKSRRYRRTTRSCSRTADGSDGPGLDASTWDCSVRGDVSAHMDWSFSHLDTDAEGGGEECPPQVPWESRVFPLCEDDKGALQSDEEELAEPRWSEREKTEMSSTDDCSSVHSHPPSALCSTILPPAGDDGNTSLTADSRVT